MRSGIQLLVNKIARPGRNLDPSGEQHRAEAVIEPGFRDHLSV
jgi:hypothetical protein